MDLYPEFFYFEYKAFGFLVFWILKFQKKPLSYLCNTHCVAFLETARGVVVAHGGAPSGLRSALLLQRAVGSILGSSPGRRAARPGLP
jgi:hypothetical protein